MRYINGHSLFNKESSEIMDRKKLLRLLAENARMTESEMAEQLGEKTSAVRAEIRKLEEEKTIIGYRALFDETLLPEHAVKALIEVKVRPEREDGFDKIARRLSKFPQVSGLYLMSGGFDLLVEVQGRTLNDVAMFVSRKLATQEGVLSTATHFLLKKYKESGKLMQEDERHDDRLNITM